MEYLDNIHIPSFGLGFATCILLYCLGPGLLLILGGLLSFLKLLLIIGPIITLGVFIYLNQRGSIQTGNRSSKVAPFKSVTRSKDEEEYKYFDIPITRLEGEKSIMMQNVSSNLDHNHNSRYNIGNQVNLIDSSHRIEEMENDGPILVQNVTQTMKTIAKEKPSPMRRQSAMKPTAYYKSTYSDVDSVDTHYTETVTIPNKTIRYESFVKMAGKNK